MSLGRLKTYFINALRPDSIRFKLDLLLVLFISTLLLLTLFNWLSYDSIQGLVEEAKTGSFDTRLNDLQKIIFRIKWAKIILIALTTILAVIVTGQFLVRRNILFRIQQIADALIAFATGDLRKRVVIDAKDEIAEMGVAYNLMAASLVTILDQLNSSKNELQRYAEILEETVKERTKDLENKNVQLYETIHQLEFAQSKLEIAISEARAANSAKTKFVANMSHELRTPLNAIVGYTDLLMEEFTEKGLDESTADLEKIQQASKHLLSLINNVLDLSKIESDTINIHLADVVLKEIVQDIADIATTLAAKKHNQFQVHTQPGIENMVLHTDALKMRQCILNLIGNATKFTENGLIKLEINVLEIDGQQMVKIAVHDTGIGIQAEHLASLFKPFSQVDSELTRKYEGSGLGLYLTERFCQLLGGHIAVESKVNVGSTFTLFLPVVSTLKKGT